MAKTRLQTRADSDTANAVDDFADEHDLSQSEAVRRMIRAGLSQYDYQIPTADGFGKADELDAIRAELDAIEQRQVEYSELRRRAEFRQTVALLAGIVYIGATLALDMSGVLWAATGVVGVIAMILTQWQLGKVSDDE